MENFFVKITGVFSGVEFIELAGVRGEKTLCSVNGNPMKMKSVHPWKTLAGAEKYIESALQMDAQMGRNRKFEIVHS